jgi:hypothetical protein
MDLDEYKRIVRLLVDRTGYFIGDTLPDYDLEEKFEDEIEELKEELKLLENLGIN